MVTGLEDNSCKLSTNAGGDRPVFPHYHTVGWCCLCESCEGFVWTVSRTAFPGTKTWQTRGLFPLLSQCTLFSCCLQLNSHTGQKQVALRNDQISPLHVPLPNFRNGFFRKPQPTSRNKRKGINRNVTQACLSLTNVQEVGELSHSQTSPVL